MDTDVKELEGKHFLEIETVDSKKYNERIKIESPFYELSYSKLDEFVIAYKTIKDNRIRLQENDIDYKMLVMQEELFDRNKYEDGGKNRFFYLIIGEKRYVLFFESLYNGSTIKKI